MKHLLIGTAAIALLAGCTPKASAPAENDKVALTETTPPIANADGKFETSEGLLLSAPDYWGSWGIDLSVQDTSVTPGNDFYAWTNGKCVTDSRLRMLRGSV